MARARKCRLILQTQVDDDDDDNEQVSAALAASLTSEAARRRLLAFDESTAQAFATQQGVSAMAVPADGDCVPRSVWQAVDEAGVADAVFGNGGAQRLLTVRSVLHDGTFGARARRSIADNSLCARPALKSMDRFELNESLQLHDNDQQDIADELIPLTAQSYCDPLAVALALVKLQVFQRVVVVLLGSGGECSVLFDKSLSQAHANGSFALLHGAQSKHVWWAYEKFEIREEDSEFSEEEE